MKYERINLDNEISSIFKNSKLILITFFIVNMFSIGYIYTNHKDIFELDRNVWVENTTHMYNYKLSIDRNISIKKLELINNKLSESFKVNSILNIVKWKMLGDETSNMLNPSFKKINESSVDKYIKSKKYRKYVDNDNFYFYVVGEKILNKKIISDIISLESFDFKEYYFSKNNINDLILELSFIYLLLFVFSLLLFRTIHSGVFIVYISFSIVLSSISLIHMFMPNEFIDYRIIYIIIVTSIIDFLYFQYRWVLFYSKIKEKQYSLKYSILSNFKPAFWTTLIISLSVVILLFFDSNIIKLLSLSIIISSFITFIFNLLLFPLLAQFFTPRPLNSFLTISKKIKFYFSEPKLNGFLTTLIVTISTLTIIAFIAMLVFKGPTSFTNIDTNNKNIIIQYKTEASPYKIYNKFNDFDKFLKVYFYNSEVSTYSIVNEINKLKQIDNQKYKKKSQEFYHLNYIITSSDINDKIFLNDNYVMFIYNLKEEDKIELYKNILPNSNFEAIDLNSKINKEKINTSFYLSISIFLSLIILSVFIAVLFKNKRLFYYTFIINILPIIIFSGIIYIQKIPISFELMIVMTISFVLTTDSVIHFNFRYWKSRYLYNFSKNKSLRELFLYSVLPMVISSVMIICIFIILGFIHSEFSNYSLYIIELISINIFIDAILYPILLVNADSQKTLTIKVDCDSK